MSASSAARSLVSVRRRFVSSNSRAFSRATPGSTRGVLEQPLVGLVEGVLLDALEGDDADDPVARRDRRRRATTACPEPPTWMRPGGRLLLDPTRCRSERPRPDHRRGQPVAERERHRRCGRLPSIHVVRERRSVPAAGSYRSDEHGARRLEDRRRSARPTSSMIAWNSSCSASAAPISLMTASSAGALVRLGQQPLRLVEQPGVLEGDAHARGERRRAAARRPR